MARTAGQQPGVMRAQRAAPCEIRSFELSRLLMVILALLIRLRSGDFS